MSKAWRILGCIAAGALIAMGIGYVTMLLWNWLVPVLFNGPVISFWQSVGLLVLSKILFHGLGKRHWRKNHGDGDHWKGKLEKFSNMSPEEKEAFKKKMKAKWCNRDQSQSEAKTNDFSA